jgi:hypothetical protein
MDHIGIDVHKKDSQTCILAEDGELIERRVRTEAESATESEWVARCLEGLGHEVIGADPNFVSMYEQRSRKMKTDRRDARALAEACVLGAYHRAHRLSDGQRHVRGRLTVRDALGANTDRLHHAKDSQSDDDVVGARVSPWPQSERRCVDGAPPLFDSPRAPTSTVSSLKSANRRVTELARPKPSTA